LAQTPFERSYWVVPGKLLAGEIPASAVDAQTQAKLEGLLKVNTNVVVNLMEEGESNHHNVPFADYAPYLQERGVEVIRFPIRDVSIPTVDTMTQILDTIDDRISQGKTVYVHCWGGIGRTGTTVGCYLIRHGLATEDTVFDEINELKRNTSIAGKSSPETYQQREFVQNWVAGQ
jgi:protein-tyrosine phosphatase